MRRHSSMKSRPGKSNATPSRPPLTGGFQSRMHAKNSKGFIHYFHRDELLVYTRLLALMPSTLPPRLDALLQVEASHASSLQALKAPPGFPSARALLRLLDKLEQIHSMSVLALDLSWLHNNLQTTFARQVAQASAYRLRELLDRKSVV